MLKNSKQLLISNSNVLELHSWGCNVVGGMGSKDCSVEAGPVIFSAETGRILTALLQVLHHSGVSVIFSLPH